MTGRQRFYLLGGVVSLAALAAFVTMYKPIRVFVPEYYGLSCVTEEICLEEPERLAEARALYDEAAIFAQDRLGAFENRPRVLFCSTEACGRAFGNPYTKGQNVGVSGVIIYPSGWDVHILSHEMIHHMQYEHFGVLRAARLPRWFLDGMAYSMSEDPRWPHPHPEIDQMRAQFDDWVAAGNSWDVPPS